jgi:hypothetical protein
MKPRPADSLPVFRAFCDERENPMPRIPDGKPNVKALAAKSEQAAAAKKKAADAAAAKAERAAKKKAAPAKKKKK